MIDNILIGGHEAEMAALEELERSDELRLLSRQLAARDLCEAASELLDMVDGSWEPTENLFGGSQRSSRHVSGRLMRSSAACTI